MGPIRKVRSAIFISVGRILRRLPKMQGGNRPTNRSTIGPELNRVQKKEESVSSDVVVV